MTDTRGSRDGGHAGTVGGRAPSGGGFRPHGDAAGRLGEGLAAAGEVVSRSVRRSVEEARDARESLRGRGGGDLGGAGLLLGVADEARSQALLGAWTALAAGERFGRSLVGPGSRRRAAARVLPPGVLSARTLALGTAALDLYAGYAALRERRRRFPGLVREADYELQHRRGAGRTLDAAQALGATLIKAGQFASSRPDLLPPPYIRALSTLQDRVPPRPFGVIRRRIEEETGRPLYKTFFRVDPEPIAAASIAQVHRARLADGREVAVKVRYPEVAGLVEEDLAALESIFDVVGRLQPDVQLRPISDYLRWSLPLELDLSRETRAMKELRDALADREDVAVPRPVDGLATEGLLVMDYFEGIRVNDRAALVEAGIDPSEVAVLLNDAFADQLFRRGILHADPHPGNLLVQPGPRLVLLDHGLTLRLDESFVGTLAGVVSALGGGDLEAVGGALRDAGLPVGEGADLETLLQLVGVVLGGGDAGDAAGGEDEDETDAADLGNLTGKIGAAVRDLPPRLLLVGRAIALLDGVTGQLDEELDALEIVSRYADGGGGSSPA